MIDSLATSGIYDQIVGGKIFQKNCYEFLSQFFDKTEKKEKENCFWQLKMMKTSRVDESCSFG